MKVINTKGIVILAVVLLVIQLGVGLILSPMLGAVIVENINKASNTKILVDKVNVWPMTLSCTLKGIKVFEPGNEKERMVLIPKASIRLSLMGLLSKRIILSQVKVIGAEVDLKGESDGSFNVQKLASGSEAPKQKAGILDRFKGKQDWFSRIYNMIKKKSSKEAVEKKEEEQKEARTIKREVQELPKGRRVKFTTLSDGYVFQIREFVIKNARINVETQSKESVTIEKALIEVRNLGIDPVKGARFDKLDIQGNVAKEGASAGQFSFEYAQAFKSGKQLMTCNVVAKDIDLTAIKFVYENSVPVNFNKGTISLKSKTNFVNAEMDSKNSISLKNHDVAPKGSQLAFGIVPLPALCEALNQVNPVNLKFEITGTIDNPQVTGFKDSLMVLLKPYLSNITENLKKQGANLLSGFLNQKSE